MKIEYKSAAVQDIAQKKEYIETVLKKQESRPQAGRLHPPGGFSAGEQPADGRSATGNMMWKPIFASSLSPGNLSSIES